MRPTFLGFETQKRTIQVAQKNLDIAGNNISNINTVGYTRQRVDLYAMYVSGNRSLRWCSNTNNLSLTGQGVNAYGVYVVDVVQGGPADKAGLKAGDRIVSIDNTEVAQKTDLGTLMQKHAAGDTLSITIAREGQMQTVNVTLGEKTASNS